MTVDGPSQEMPQEKAGKGVQQGPVVFKSGCSLRSLMSWSLLRSQPLGRTGMCLQYWSAFDLGHTYLARLKAGGNTTYPLVFSDDGAVSVKY